MTDEPVIDKLRAAALGGPAATQAHVQGAAQRGLRMRRRRQAAAAVGSAVTVSGFAALLIVTSPSDQTVVQGAAPVGGTRQPSASPMTAVQRQLVNLEALDQVLGTDSWRLGPAPVPGAAYKGVDLIPGSAAAKGLPAGWTAQGEVLVLAYTGTSLCSGAGAPGTCRIVHPARGGVVSIRHDPAPTEAEDNAISMNFASAEYVRPDGYDVTVHLHDAAAGKATKAATAQAATWLAQFDDELTAAATDPRMLSDPSQTPPPTPIPVQSSDPTPVAGIQDGVEGPFSPIDFEIRNTWDGPVGTDWVGIYAGEIRDGADEPGGHPGLKVYVFSNGPYGPAKKYNGRAFRDIQVPGPVGGSARIVSESDGVLTVVASDGTQSRFDLTTDTVE
jgi:hypothetical protein